MSRSTGEENSGKAGDKSDSIGWLDLSDAVIFVWMMTRGQRRNRKEKKNKRRKGRESENEICGNEVVGG